MNWLFSNKTLIQNALPTLSDDQREFLMTGFTPAEWDEIFNDPEYYNDRVF